MRDMATPVGAGSSLRAAAREWTGKRWVACVVSGLLALAGCSTPGGGPSAPSPTSSPAPAPAGSERPGMPEKVFTDAELEAIINAVAQSRNLPGPMAQSSERLRSAAASRTAPYAGMVATPAECVAFVPEDPIVRWADRDVNFAEGGMPVSGQSGPTTTIMITLRSAEKVAIAKADFGYTDDMVSRCSEFDLASADSGRTSTYAVHLLPAPGVGERQHGLMQTTKPKGPGDFGSVGLRVLGGTVSISLSLAVQTLNSESDAQPALDSMAALGKELLDHATKNPPTVAAPPPNSRTPDDLVALFKGVTGPDGNPVTLQGASVIGPAPGQGTPSTRAPEPPCTLSDPAYYDSLQGAVLGQGTIQAASKIDYVEFSVVSMPLAAAPPYPFDTRAAALHDCSTIQEEPTGGSARPWSALARLNVTVPADASYAVAYQLSDGTGEWHVRAGARKGSLSVEANGRTPSQAQAQATADKYAAFLASVFSRAGL